MTNDDLKDTIMQLIQENGKQRVLSILAKNGMNSVSLATPTASQVCPESLRICEAVEMLSASPRYRSLTPSSQHGYTKEMNQLLKRVDVVLKDKGGQNAFMADLIRPLFLMDFLEGVNNPNTRNRRISFLRTFLRVTLGGEITDNLAQHVLKLKDTYDTTPKAFLEKEVLELMHEALARQMGLRDHAMIAVLAGTGIRLDELTGMTLGDIQWDERFICIRPKGRKEIKEERAVPRATMSVLMHYLECRYGDRALWHRESDRYVFPSRSNTKKSLTNRNVEQIVRSLVDNAKSIPAHRKGLLTVHSFRHYFALERLKNGVDIATIAKLLGHRSIGTSMKYLLLFRKDLLEAVDQTVLAGMDPIFIRRMKEDESK